MSQMPSRAELDDAVHQATRHLTAVARQHGGEYDGWGCAVVA
jgi:hypothetical protein